jgi:Fe-S-cluster containining protein
LGTPVEVIRLAKQFPYTFDASGHCEMLMDNNECAVYHDRPAICNTDVVRKYYTNMTDDQYESALKEACGKLRDEQKAISK